MTYSSSSDSSAWRTPVIVGVVIALAVVVGLLLALVLSQPPETASGDPTPTPSGAPSVPPSAAPSEAPSEAASDAPSAPAEPSDAAGPTPVVEAPDGVLPPGSVARVVADALRVREGPTTSATEVTSLGQGQLVVLGFTVSNPSWGPIEADGFAWYPVTVLDVNALPEPGGEPLPERTRGWAAVGDGTDTWLQIVAPRCTDAEPTLQLLASLTEWERLACYGDRSLTIEGVFGCGGCGGLYPGGYEPEWLAHPNNYDFLSVEPQDRVGPFRIFFPPDGPARPDEPGVAPILRVTGHFDDPAADGCRVAPGEPEQVEIDPVVAQLYCRSHFVVESVEVIGVDEDFPFG